jgi:hypothetical protein
MTIPSLLSNILPKRRHFLTTLLISVICLLILTKTITINFQGDMSGLYLLRGVGGKLLELRDDVYLGEAGRVLARLDVNWLHDLFNSSNGADTRLRYKWNARGGHGYIHSTRTDGTEFVICLSRFLDSSGKMPRGLFIGGELPPTFYGKDGLSLNETGMALQQGNRWYHIWCNANEGIAGGNSPKNMIFPSEWEFLGSKVLFVTQDEIALKSSHRTELDGVPVSIDRYLFFNANNRFLTLSINIKNIGDRPTGYYYVYGDEPWLGDYGTSKGNVGWAKDKLYYYAGIVDPVAHSTAGMADLGNPISPFEQGRDFSGLANFISWIGMVRPSLVYFANKEGDPHEEKERVPLDSPNNRVIFCQWGPVKLLPQESTTITLAIGMAERDKKTGIPVQPELKLDWDAMNKLMNAR